MRAAAGSRRFGQPGAWVASAAYVLLTLVLTWPLPMGLTRDVPMDLADPLLNSWIVGWGAEHVRRFASGDWAAFAGFWNANIFHPAPLTLAYSEHLFAQALQATPVYAATHNVILCYNLLFLSTFALSGIGLFLLLRDVTGDAAAAFAGGVMFAFAPYRFEHATHLQLLSFHWLPFALLGLRRWAWTARLRPLALGTLALVAHGLSCGYYLLFFSPFVAAYALYETHAAGRRSSRRHWLGLGVAALVTLAATLPFLLPYVQAREQAQTVRSALTVRQFSADLAAWVTATPESRLWGPRLVGFDRGEGHLFPGLTPVALALLAITGAVLACWRAQPGTRAPWRAAAGLAACLAVGLVAAHLLGGGDSSLPLMEGGFAAAPLGILVFALAALLMALALSAGVRQLAARAASSFTGFAAGSCLLGLWLSLGTEPRLWGFDLGVWGPYSLLYAHVPGFDGLRAPGRYAAVVVLFLSLLAGLGFARLRRARFGAVAAALVLGGFLLESVCVPLPLNRNGWDSAGLRRPPLPGDLPEPPVYAVVRTLPADAVLLELPVGEILWETHAMFRSTRHWRALVNGYSGYFPLGYIDVRAAFRDALRDPDEAWRVLRESGATHVIVHGRAWFKERVGERIVSDLEARGARRLFEGEGDVLVALPPPPPKVR